MNPMPIMAVVPVKETHAAKQRLAPVLSPALRQRLVLAMLEDVLGALATASLLAGIMIVTQDEAVAECARARGIAVSSEGASDGHTGAVTAAARRLAAAGTAMLTVPGDIPLVQAADIDALAATLSGLRGFTIAPARDERGSNAILSWPADTVPLRFGENSYFPHLAAARAVGVSPRSLVLPRIGLDIDGPEDLAEFLIAPGETHAGMLLRKAGITLKDLKQEAGG